MHKSLLSAIEKFAYSQNSAPVGKYNADSRTIIQSAFNLYLAVMCINYFPGESKTQPDSLLFRCDKRHEQILNSVAIHPGARICYGYYAAGSFRLQKLRKIPHFV